MIQKRAATALVFLSPIFLSIFLLIPGSLPAQQPSQIRMPTITALAATPDGAGYVSGSQAGLAFRAWDGESDQAIATGLDHVHHLSFSPDGSLLAVAGGSPAESGEVELWSWPERKRLRQLEGHDDVVYAAEWLGDGKTIVTASADRTVRVWDSATGELRATLTGHSGPVLCLAVAPDGKLICSGSADQTIRVWDTSNWQLVRAMTNHLGPVHGLSFREPAAAGSERRPSYLASAGGDGTVRIWQPEIGRMVRIVRHPAPAFCVGWDEAGILWSGSKDGQLRMIDADLGAVRREEPRSSGWIMSLCIRGAGPQIVIGDSLGQIAVSP